MHWELLEVELFYMLSQALLLKRSLDRIACQTDQPHGCDTAIKWLQAHTMTLLWWWLIWLSSAKSSHWSAWLLDPPAKRFGKALSLSWHCLGIVAVSLVETGTAIRAVHAQTELKRPVTMSMVHSVQPSPAADPCYVKHLMLNAKQARTGERWHGVCHWCHGNHAESF